MKGLLTTLITLAVLSTVVSADVAKGQKLYMKKLKSSCAISGSSMAGKHTQGEWQEIKESGKLAEYFQLICPKVKDKSLKEKYLEHYFDFFYEYASDSGNVPSC